MNVTEVRDPAFSRNFQFHRRDPTLQLLKRELEPETFNEIFVEGGIFDGALVDFLNELFPNADIPPYPGLPEVPEEGWRCMKGTSLCFKSY